MEKHINSCIKTELWNEHLKPDCDAASCFVSFRRDEIGFYYYNKLFGFTVGDSFSTHRKYAAIIKSKGDYVTQAELANVKLVTDFCKSYNDIKNVVKTYSKNEATCRTPLIQKFAYSNPKVSEIYRAANAKRRADDKFDEIVVLDVEFGYLGLEGDKFNIDLTLYNRDTDEIRFVEVKTLGDSRLWTEGGKSRKRGDKDFETEDIIMQIEKYETATLNNNAKIADFYADYIAAADKVFNMDLRRGKTGPVKVCNTIGLLVCDYEDAQFKAKTEKQMPFYYGAKTASIRERGSLGGAGMAATLGDWWKKWDDSTGAHKIAEWERKYAKAKKAKK